MSLASGTRLGPYEILAPIGAGGMGEVYRARDTRLKREVALKVLPDSFASDRERMARFQSEAEILASLNHPNIAQIYGPENTTNLHSFAISPDGRLFAVAAVVNGKRQLWLRALDALQAQPMPGIEDAAYPFWSPDSHYIGFFAQGKLKKITAGGGPAQSLCDAPDGHGGSWNRTDVILFSPRIAGGAIQRISATGGVQSDVIKNDGFSLFPVFLPDGRHFLYLVRGVSVEQNGVYLSSLDGKENQRVLAGLSTVVFADGRLLFVRENTLMSQPFDAASGQATGEAFPVIEGVNLTTSINYAPVTVSETGVLLYESSGVTAGSNQMVWYDRTGRLLGAVSGPGSVLDPAISPDGKSIVFRRLSNSGFDLWLRNLGRGDELRLTTDASVNAAPFWSPRTDRIVFNSNRSGLFNLYQKTTSGTGRDELLFADGHIKYPSQWSRDSRFIVYSELDPKTKWDIWLLPMEIGAERKPVPFVRSEFNELFGQLSPDGHWMAYTSDESAQREIYVRPFPAGEGQWKISIAGGEQPRWRGDSQELFFIGLDGKMTVVPVKAVVGPRLSFEPEAPQALFKTHLAQGTNEATYVYDVTADGKRFLLDTVAAGASASAPLLNVVVNWDAGFKE